MSDRPPGFRRLFGFELTGDIDDEAFLDSIAAHIEMHFDREGSNTVFLVRESQREEEVGELVGFRYRIVFQEQFDLEELEDIQEVIENAFAVCLSGVRPQIVSYKTSTGSTLIDFVSGFSGISLLAFFHQYKQIRSGVILMSNDIRQILETYQRHVKQQTKRDPEPLEERPRGQRRRHLRLDD